jgi:putative drug exporter of the RND superfamily
MSGQQSADAEAAALTVRPTGDLGDADSNHSINAIRDIVAKVPKPAGLNVYVSGPSPLAADTLHAADESLTTLTLVTIVLIIVLLLIAYRSITRALIPLFGVLIGLATARGVVSLLVGLHVLGISSFATNMVVALVLVSARTTASFTLADTTKRVEQGRTKKLLTTRQSLTQRTSSWDRVWRFLGRRCA